MVFVEFIVEFTRLSMWFSQLSKQDVSLFYAKGLHKAIGLCGIARCRYIKESDYVGRTGYIVYWPISLNWPRINTGTLPYIGPLPYFTITTLCPTPVNKSL